MVSRSFALYAEVYISEFKIDLQMGSVCVCVRMFVRACIRPVSFPEHNSKIVEDISTKLATHI